MSEQLIQDKVRQLKALGMVQLARYVLILEYSLNLLQQKVDRLQK